MEGNYSRRRTCPCSTWNVASGPVVVKGGEDRDQALDDVGVALAAKVQRARMRIGRWRIEHQPDLARTAAHPRRLALLRRGERRELAAKLDHIAVAVLPFVEELEIGLDRIDRHQ